MSGRTECRCSGSEENSAGRAPSQREDEITRPSREDVLFPCSLIRLSIYSSFEVLGGELEIAQGRWSYIP